MSVSYKRFVQASLGERLILSSRTSVSCSRRSIMLTLAGLVSRLSMHVSPPLLMVFQVSYSHNALRLTSLTQVLIANAMQYKPQCRSRLRCSCHTVSLIEQSCSQNSNFSCFFVVRSMHRFHSLSIDSSHFSLCCIITALHAFIHAYCTSSLTQVFRIGPLVEFVGRCRIALVVASPCWSSVVDSLV